MGGQGPNNLAVPLSRLQVPIYGTAPVDIDRAEDRNKFSALLDQLAIQQPAWTEVTSIEAARKFAERAGYPVLIRPSYVLSGAAMNVAWDDASLKTFLTQATELSPDYPIVISKYIENSKEIEIDAVANKGEILIYAISEHLENAASIQGTRPSCSRRSASTSRRRRRSRRRPEGSPSAPDHRPVQHPVPGKEREHPGDRVQPPRESVIPLLLEGVQDRHDRTRTRASSARRRKR
jgi:carbamoylphosphate synthase large subunit